MATSFIDATIEEIPGGPVQDVASEQVESPVKNSVGTPRRRC